LMSGEGKRVGYLLVPITRPSSTLPDFTPYIRAVIASSGDASIESKTQELMGLLVTRPSN